MTRAEERAARLAALASDAVTVDDEPKLPTKVRSKKEGPRISVLHSAVLDHWFKNGCTSKKRAMIAAGYRANKDGSVATTSVFGREDVKKAIDQRRKNRATRAMKVTEDTIIAEMAKLAFVNVGDLLEVNEDGSAYFDLTQMDDDHRAALAEYSTETYVEKRTEDTGNDDETFQTVNVPVRKSRIKFASKQAALDSLARVLGMFKDKTEHTVNVASFADRIAKARQRIHAAKGPTIDA